MWAIVRGITKNTKLERKVVHSIVFNTSSDRLDNVGYEFVLMFAIRDWISWIVYNEEIEYEATSIANEWFKYVTFCIMKTAISSPTFVAEHSRKPSVITKADIIWSINNLSSTTALHALGHISRDQKFDMKLAMSSPYLLALGVCFKKKIFWGYFGSSFKNEKKFLESCSLSCEGALALFTWIRKLLQLTVKHAASIRSDIKCKISPQDMIRAFNWVRLKKFDQSMLNSPSNSQFKYNHLYSTTKVNNENNNMKDFVSRVEEPISDLPDHIIESHILPKLSIDSISTFKCVSKSWKKTIGSSHFQRLLYEQEECKIQSFGFYCANIWMEVDQKSDDFELFGISLSSHLNIYSSIVVHSSSNGFLCLQVTGAAYNFNSVFIIGNPITGEWTGLPPITSRPSTESLFLNSPGLAMELSTNRPWYKLVFTVFDKVSQQYLFYVFSSQTSEWKTSNAVHSQFFMRKGNSLYINGLLYWICDGYRLNWFDVTRDKTGHTDLPFPYEEPTTFVVGSYKPQQCGEEARLTCTVKVHDKKVETYIYYGKHEWEKILSVQISWPEKIVHPFPYMGGHYQFFIKKKEVVAHNIQTGEKKISLVVKNDSQFIIYPFAFKMNISSLPKMSERQIRCTRSCSI